MTIYVHRTALIALALLETLAFNAETVFLSSSFIPDIHRRKNIPNIPKRVKY